VNPEHLFVGTQKDNVHDSMKKGRRHSKAGVGHHLAKLTDEQVLEIRAAAKAGESRKTLAERFGVRQGAISKIVTRVRWVHI